MSSQLQNALDEIPDTGVIVISVPVHQGTDELLETWRSAHLESSAALERWRAERTRRAFAIFRAAEDRADAAQDALAGRAR